MSRIKFLLLIVLAAIVIISPIQGFADAQEPVIQAVLFYSPSCGHCMYIINEVLPPLVEEYGTQLEIYGVNTHTTSGNLLFTSFINQYDIPPEEQAVPTLLIGDLILIGSGDIPEQLPGLIEDGLAAGGIPWPDLDGFEQYRSGTLVEDTGSSPNIPGKLSVWDRFQLDLAGNILAVIILVGMILSLGFSVLSFTRVSEHTPEPFPDWLIPVLSLIGIGISGYLAFVEVNQVEAFCGPVGNCNAVQQSVYATLFGVLPVGILGILGYLGIIILWLLGKLELQRWGRSLDLTLWSFTLIGLLFSIYLTFLEPFVIGASCMWCLSSAVIMTALFLIATRKQLNS